MNGPQGQRKRPPTLVVLCSHPIQYYTPLYRSLARRGNVHLRVVYLSDAGAAEHFDRGFGRRVKWDVPLLDGYEYDVLQPGTPITTRNFWSRFDRQLATVLTGLSPDWLLLYGYASRMNWSALFWARSHGAKVAYWSDSNVRDPRPRYKSVPKSMLLKRFFFPRVDAVLTTSEANEQYVRGCGAQASTIRRVPFCIEVDRYRPQDQIGTAAPRKFDFVWAGKLIPLKRSRDFLAALDLLARRTTKPVRALLVGDGPLRSELKETGRRLTNEGVLTFGGFVNQEDMPQILQSAECLVFTSEIEAFGLVALEAAASGLAIVAADNIGCVGPRDVAREGVNAVTYKVGDVAGLATAMEEILTSGPQRLEMQRASIDIAKGYDVECAAEAIESAIGA